jgi:putative endonuclease
VVFVEVRQRQSAQFGGAAGSIGAEKRRRIAFAAQSWLTRQGTPPPCRFDVVLICEDSVQWIQAAFWCE